MGWGAIAGAIGGSLVSAWSQRAANKRNVALGREQMNFQREMSNTAYQRATKDMVAAGLNPAVAYQQGGASAPQGANPTVQSIAPNLGNLGAEIAKTGIQKDLVNSQVNKQKQEVKNLEVTNEIMNTTAKREKYNNELIKAKIPQAKAEEKFYQENPWAVKAKAIMNVITGGGNAASSALGTAAGTKILYDTIKGDQSNKTKSKNPYKGLSPARKRGLIKRRYHGLD
jgi:hypothetical protein